MRGIEEGELSDERQRERRRGGGSRGEKEVVKRKREGLSFDHVQQYPAMRGGKLLHQFCFIKERLKDRSSIQTTSNPRRDLSLKHIRTPSSHSHQHTHTHQDFLKSYSVLSLAMYSQ